MRPLGDVALGEYGPWELLEAAEDTRTCSWLYDDDEECEENAELFELFAWTLFDIRFLDETGDTDE